MLKYCFCDNQMSEHVKLNQEIKEIEEVLKTLVEINKQKENAKTEINDALNENNETITQINIINYLYEALT